MNLVLRKLHRLWLAVVSWPKQLTCFAIIESLSFEQLGTVNGNMRWYKECKVLIVSTQEIYSRKGS